MINLRRGGIAAVILAAGLLGGCGLYFHNDAYQKRTDAAADAVEAALFTPRIQEIGKEAIAVSGEYESAIVVSDVALRDRLIVAVIKKPIALAPVAPTDPNPSDAPWYGLGLLKAETNRRLGEIVGAANVAEYGDLGSGLRADMASMQKDLEGFKREYELDAQSYRSTPRPQKKDDISCDSIASLSTDDRTAFGLDRLAIRCKRVADQQLSIRKRLFGDNEGSLDKACDANIAAGELQQVYCAIRASDLEAQAATAEKKRLAAEIKALADTFKPSGAEDDPADKDFIAAVEKLQATLEKAELPKEARAFGYDMLAEILKEALAFDVAAAIGEATGAPTQPPADGQGDETKAAMAGAIIRVVTTGVKFGQAYEAQPPFDRANTVIIALAELRHKAGVAEIAAQTERARITYLQRRQEALIREVDVLSASWRLQQTLPQDDIVSLSGDEALRADAALGTYVASVNRGLIPNRVFQERIRNLDIKELDAISVLSGQSTDQVTKAAAAALRAYGKGGVDPDVVFGEILGVLAVAGIWL